MLNFGELEKSNAQSVERLTKIILDLGLEIATPAEAHEILGLPSCKNKFSGGEINETHRLKRTL